MLANERKKVILECLGQRQRVTLEELQILTDSSVSTIRRDLNELAEAKMLRRVHGGAELIQDLSAELSMFEKSSKNVQEKAKIAKLALSQIKAGDIIFLDAGTTTGALISELHRFKQPLTIVTNSVTHASNLVADYLTVHILGGQIKTRTDSVVGGQALRQLAQYRFNSAFLGANAYDKVVGAMTPDSEEAMLKMQAIRQADESFVLLDSSKIGKTSFVRFAIPEEITVLTENGGIE